MKPIGTSLPVLLLAGVSLFAFSEPVFSLPALPGVRPLQEEKSPPSASDFERANRLFSFPRRPTISVNGMIEADKSTWLASTDSDGTNLFTLKSGTDAKAAAIRKKDELESFTAFSLDSSNSDPGLKLERSGSVSFKNGKITSFTSCEESSGKDSIGRICVTATPSLCRKMRDGEPLTPEVIKELDTSEMRSLALILTLRGSDHQLDNTVRYGNHLGLKSALQTTRGQLVTLAQQIAKEMAAVQKQPSAPRAPSSAEESNTKIARFVLERSLPKLKNTCIEAGF